jgi:hypothetical protein
MPQQHVLQHQVIQHEPLSPDKMGNAYAETITGKIHSLSTHKTTELPHKPPAQQASLAPPQIIHTT